MEINNIKLVKVLYKALILSLILTIIAIINPIYSWFVCNLSFIVLSIFIPLIAIFSYIFLLYSSYSIYCIIIYLMDKKIPNLHLCDFESDDYNKYTYQYIFNNNCMIYLEGKVLLYIFNILYIPFSKENVDNCFLKHKGIYLHKYNKAIHESFLKILNSRNIKNRSKKYE